MKILNFLLLFIISTGAGYRILAIFPIPSRSHQLYNNEIVKTLAMAGHDVTVITAISFWKDPPPNYHFIQFNRTLSSKEGSKFFEWNSITISKLIQNLWTYGEEMCEVFLAEPGLEPFKQSKGQFDVLIVESFFNECFMGFAHILDIPLIQLVSYIGSSWITDSVGAPIPYSYVYEPYLDVEPHMFFFDRFRNTIFGIGIKFARNWIYLPKIDKLMRKHFQDENMPSISEIETSRTSLLLLNNHESLSYAKPGMPNMVNVAGMHIEANKALPSNLQKFMNEATNGVIYISMGSNIKMKEMDSEKLSAFIKVLSKMNQRIIWRWDQDFDIPKEPKNILFSTWLPQIDILSHPNLKIFATHGGLMSTIEALDKGVPVVGFPIFADQVINLRRFQAKGLGLVVEYKNISETSLDWAFKEILKPKYTENAKKYSRLFHDREKTPHESTVWWVDYIIRHKGARHLRSPGMDQTWYQYYLLDIIVLLNIALYILYRVVKFFFNLIITKGEPQKKIKKQ